MDAKAADWEDSWDDDGGAIYEAYPDVEFDPETGIFFGWVDSQFSEWGNFSLEEMESLKVRGLGMERDKFFTPKPMKDIADYKRDR